MRLDNPKSQSDREQAADVKGRVARTAGEVEQAILADLDGWTANLPGLLGEAIRYAMLGGGKRLRPVMLLWSADLFGGSSSSAMPAAVAVEMLHTYSLVHDDLPAMDDDDLRRGRPTCHKVYGDGMAVLVGDALLTRSFEVLADSGLPADRVTALVRTLAKAGGAAGMIGGQAEDLAWQFRPSDLETVEYIHGHKTAALFAAACRMGAVAAGADATAEDAMRRFGWSLGLAFQIVDDLLDEVGQTAELGKRAGKDRSAGKLTYVAVAGVDAARQAARARADEARAVLDELAVTGNPRLDDLADLSRYIVDRTN